MNTCNSALHLAANQGGVIRLDQALSLGISTSSIRRRTQASKWRRVAKGVYRLIDMDSPRDRVLAAVAALPGAVASHETAAEFHSIPRLPRDKAIVTVHSKTTHTFPGVTVRRTRDLAAHHTTTANGIPTTTVERTVVDLSAWLHPRHLEEIVDDLVAAKRLDLDTLSVLIASIARRGKAGSATLRNLIAERVDSGVPFASRLERLGLATLVRAGLQRPMTEYRAPWDSAKRLDAAYPAAKVGIEWDSRRWHTQAAAFQQDRERDRRALLHGWRVFRFTWQDVTDRPHVVVGTIRSALAGDCPPT